MWVTQTYLGNVESDAHLFVYYLYEDYNSTQNHLTTAIQRELEILGEVYKDRVSLLMPNPRYAGKVEAEVREFPELWMAVRELLPGLLLSPVPLIELRASSEGARFIPLRDGSPDRLARIVAAVRHDADGAIDIERETNSPRPGWIKRIADAIEIKPGIWGINLDIRRLSR